MGRIIHRQHGDLREYYADKTDPTTAASDPLFQAAGILQWYPFYPRQETAYINRFGSWVSPSITSSSVANSWGKYGYLRRQTGESGYWHHGDDGVRTLITNKATFFIDFEFQSGGTGASFIFGNVEGISGAGYNWGFYVTGTNQEPYFYIKTGGSATSIRYSHSLSGLVNKRLFIVVTYDGNEMISYLNGDRLYTKAKTGNLDTTNLEIVWNRWGTLSDKRCRYYSCGFGNKVLTHDQIRELAARRGQFGRRIYHRPFVYPSVAGPAATVTRFHTDDISRGAALGASSSLDGALVT